MRNVQCKFTFFVGFVETVFTACGLGASFFDATPWTAMPDLTMSDHNFFGVFPRAKVFLNQFFKLGLIKITCNKEG